MISEFEDSFSWCLSLLPSVFTAVAKSVIHFWTMGFEQQEYDKGFTFHRVNRLTSQRYEQPHCCHGKFSLSRPMSLETTQKNCSGCLVYKVNALNHCIFSFYRFWILTLKPRQPIPKFCSSSFPRRNSPASKNSKCRSSHDSQWKRRTLLKKQRQL